MSAKKGILLYSGGLDSLLAARILIDQDIDLIGLNFLLPFYPPDISAENLKHSKRAEAVGLKLRHIKCGHDYMEMVRKPSHGYGKNMNPCIDCKIFFLNYAKNVMKEEKASFVATGEVVGQRPMSQMKHMLNHIEKECGLQGYLLRPLSAKLLNPTFAENKGIVDREKLYDISGRSRKMQMAIAQKYNIKDYSSPAGGCLFTDKNIAGRLKDLFDHIKKYNMCDIYFLKIGRHYRLRDNAKIIVSRNEKENIELEKYKEFSDYFILPNFKGPVVYVNGVLNDKDFSLICSIIGRYSKLNDDENTVVIQKKGADDLEMRVDDVIEDDLLDEMRI